MISLQDQLPSNIGPGMEPDMSMLSSEPPVGESMRLLSSLVLDNTNDEAARDEPLSEDVYDDHLEDFDEDGMPLENTGSSNNLSLSQKHRSDKDAFESWLAQNRVSITDSRADETVLHDEDKTTASLVREFEASKIIESPRDYQVELFEKAKQKNVIAVLDTGSGKTLIAALLLRHMIDKELEDRSQGKPARLSFFLVDKVALVFQQHAVLECNLSHSVAKFSGDKVDLRWTSKSFWDDVLRDNMAIVCTADILLKCLHHSYVCMEQINLLIFDEAHHTKKNHAYARIIKDFYAHECPSNRPKIFGMTASPVDARTNIAQAAEELEALLHSEIATVSNDLLLHSVAKPKKEWVLHYHVSLRPPLTELTEKLGRLVGDHRLFAKNFHFARDGLIYLGPWLVDRFWQLIFRAEELAKQEAKAEIDSLPCSTALGRLSGAREIDTSEPALPKGLGQESATNSTNVAAVREASRLVQEYAFIMPSKQMLSNKVRRLHETLSDEYSKLDGRKTRCIVFVDQRYTAILLADLLTTEKMKIPHLLPDVLIGGGSRDIGRNSFRTQVLTISKFKQGLVNCLFATSIAEEGLDIPDCNLIIRFDLYRTMIQYIQSRGRARHHESTYVHMTELGNLEHSRLLSENKASENKMRDFCNELPEDRKLKGNDFNMDYFLRKETDQQSFQVPSTKARLTYRSSLVILAQYVDSLPHSSEGIIRAEYSVFYTAKGFVCEVSLPPSSPIRHATGRPHQRKQIAKCAAAFAMCLRLYEKKYLDKHLKPIFASRLPVMRNARLAISSRKQEKYKMRTKPKVWLFLGTPTQLFATILRLRSPEAMYRPSRPLVLLTRGPVPRIPEIPLFFGEKRASLAECVPLDDPLIPTAAELDSLAAYTLKLFDDVFSKWYKGTAADFPYLIAPCSVTRHGFILDEKAPTRSILDWAGINAVSQATDNPYTGNEPDAFFTNKFVSDPFDGSRKFYMRHVRRDLKPLDPVPEGVPQPKHRMWNRNGTKHDILNYSVSLWSKARSKMSIKEDQPVVEAEIITNRRNLLDDRVHLDNPEQNICFLVLETLKISPLPAEIVAMAFNFPVIIHRIESTLIALEATSVIGIPRIRPELALEAVTKDCDNPDAQDETPLNFQAGMGRNYERLELLGDSFLKLATSIALFTLVPDKDEFEYHVQRMCMICNRNLFNNALDMKLEEYIRSREFDRTWYPPTIEEAGKSTDNDNYSDNTPAPPSQHGLVLQKGKRTQLPTHHPLGDKTIADVCEAMIGAAYLTTYEERNFDLAVQAVSAVVKSKLHPMQSYAEYHTAYKPPGWQWCPSTAAQLHMAVSIAKDLGYHFRFPRLLRSAFTHPSYPRIYENLPSYQRLEFLGDALLDMATVDYLFHNFSNKDPQWLTEHKMAMVSNQFLAFLSVSLGFHRHILSFSGEMRKQILEYVTKVEEERVRAESEVVEAGRPASEFARDYWVHVTHPPKALADVLEAYVGALFVDSEYDYHGTVLKFFNTHVQPYFKDMSLYDTFANKHPVTFAVKMLSQRFGCRDWRVIVQETPDTEGEGCVTFATKVAAGFLVHGQVVGHGIAESGRYAKIGAAKRALAKFSTLSISAFQTLTGCQCSSEPEAVIETDEELSTAV